MADMHFSESKQLYKEGDKLYCIDLSSFQQHNENAEILNMFLADDIRRRMRDEKIPFVVVNPIPYQHDWRGQMEWFIDVKFGDSDDLYRIFNTDCLVYKNWASYEYEMEDIDECAAFGY